MNPVNSKDIVYIGYYVDDRVFDAIMSKGINNMSAARQNLEYALLKEFASFENVKFKALSYVPASDSIAIPENTRLDGLLINHIPIVKGSVYSCIKAAWKFWKYVKTEIPDGSNILMYAINPVFSIPLFIVKRSKRLTLTTICSEVPAYRRYKRTLGMKLKQFIQTYFNNRFDKYILLTERMKDVVCVADKPYMVMEGIASNLPLKPITAAARRNIVMYAGGLHPDNNIMLLIQACEKSGSVEECWICGAGPQAEEIQNIASNSTKIKYFGQKSHQDILEMEKQVKILVNLRSPNNELTSYSFPSKILEYLASGAMVVSTRLRGIPDEYFDYLYACDGEDINELSSIFDEIMYLSDDCIRRKNEESLYFLKTQKSAPTMVKKVVDFLLS